MHKHAVLITICCCCCSVTKSCPTLCDPMNCSTPGFPVYHHLPEFAQTLIHWVCDAIQTSHLLLSPSPPALSLPQHQSLFQWVGSSHQVAKVLELQHQCFQWIFSFQWLFSGYSIRMNWNIPMNISASLRIDWFDLLDLLFVIIITTITKHTSAQEPLNS